MVAAASVGVVILGARLVSGRRARLPDSVIPTPDTRDPAPKPERRTPTFRPAGPPRPERPLGLAHLRGRVIAPAGTDLEGLTVVADDGTREYEADSNATGEFQLHLPARIYTLTATLDELVGVKTGVRARPGADEEVTLDLAPGATISGVIRHPEGHEDVMTITIARAGTSLEAAEEREEEDEGHFEIGGLVPGGLYDVTFAGDGRPTVLRGVTAPATLEVVLPVPVTLSGSIGFAAGTKCPFHQISLEDEDDEEQTEVDRNCHFQFEDLTPGQEVLLKASGHGWHLEERISLPAQGEPQPVCLNPPCRSLPREEAAVLRIILTGAPDDARISASAGQGDEGGVGCASSGHSCDLSGLEVGVPAQLTVSAPGCVTVNREVTPTPGTNTLNIPCRRMRLVEGVARGGDAQQPITVQCRQGGQAQLRANAVFELHCPRDVTELLYRKGARDPWRRAPLAPETDPVFVELTL
jgi:hypothetical protein